MSRNTARPLSPHLSIWKWGPHMAISILHRITGNALAVAGGLLLIWWLVSAAGGEASYAKFIDCMTSDAGGLNWFPLIVLVGLSWSFFQHLFSGIRHFVLDTGAGYDLKINRTGSILAMAAAILATAALWAYILGGQG